MLYWAKVGFIRSTFLIYTPLEKVKNVIFAKIRKKKRAFISQYCLISSFWHVKGVQDRAYINKIFFMYDFQNQQSDLYVSRDNL